MADLKSRNLFTELAIAENPIPWAAPYTLEGLNMLHIEFEERTSA